MSEMEVQLLKDLIPEAKVYGRGGRIAFKNELFFKIGFSSSFI